MDQWASMSRPFSLEGQQLLMEGCRRVRRNWNMKAYVQTVFFPGIFEECKSDLSQLYCTFISCRTKIQKEIYLKSLKALKPSNI